MIEILSKTLVTLSRIDFLILIDKSEHHFDADLSCTMHLQDSQSAVYHLSEAIVLDDYSKTIILFDLSKETLECTFGDEIGIEFREKNIPTVRMTCVLSRVGAEVLNTVCSVALACSMNELYSDLLSCIITINPIYNGTPYALDIKSAVGASVLLHGWIANLATFRCTVVSDDFSCFARHENLYLLNRLDVTNSIAKENYSVHTDLHGFSTILTRKFRSTSHKLFLIVSSNDDIYCVGSFEIQYEKNWYGYFDLIWNSHKNFNCPEPEFLTNLIHPLLRSDETKLEYEVISFGNQSQEPEVSIIVPIFGESYFIRSILIQADLSPSNCEWIIICDDPRYVVEIIKYVSSRSRSIKRAIRLVINKKNYGFSVSNNIGVQVSTAPYICFMNSDVWIDDFRVILNAKMHLENNSFQLIGFRLLFEDGSLQHDGIEFVRSIEYQNMYLAEHHGKGLPVHIVKDAVDQVRAVTGALMMTRKSLFLDIGGFDPIYIKGDFEDVDLCLRFEASNHKIGILRSNVAYHLERQSISKIKDSSLRYALTLVNCAIFNSKWLGKL